MTIRPVGRAQGESDERLMQRVQRGEARALERLFDRYRGPLFGFLVRRSGDVEMAEDLLQESWLRVVRSRERFDPSRRFSTWLFQIANNLCRDHARRRAVRERGRERVETEAAPAQPSQAPLDLRIEMKQRLERLPDPLREVLVLRYYHGLGERQIAEVVGAPAGTVKSRLHRAVRRLRDEAGSNHDD